MTYNYKYESTVVVTQNVPDITGTTTTGNVISAAHRPGRVYWVNGQEHGAICWVYTNEIIDGATLLAQNVKWGE